MIPADEAALREIAERHLQDTYRYPFRQWNPLDQEVILTCFREAFALGRANGWQAGAEAQREAIAQEFVGLPGLAHHAETAIRNAPLVTDDQRASALTVQPSPASHGKDAASSADARRKEDATPAPSRSEHASVSGERDGERCAREGCGFPANANVHNRCHAKPCGIDCHEFQPTDRNTGRDAELREAKESIQRLWTLANRWVGYGLTQEDLRAIHHAAAYWEAALKGGGE